jgi:hypothetical protein
MWAKDKEVHPLSDGRQGPTGSNDPTGRLSQKVHFTPKPLLWRRACVKLGKKVCTPRILGMHTKIKEYTRKNE